MRLQQGAQFLAKVLQFADQAWLELNIPQEIRIDVKLVEHALCEFNKYCRWTFFKLFIYILGSKEESEVAGFFVFLQ